MDGIKERVARGAEWLDQVRPDWRDRVNPDFLEMRLGTTCILGQAFADLATPRRPTGYWYAYEALLDADSLRARDYGFVASKPPWWTPETEEQAEREYAALQEEWKLVLA